MAWLWENFDAASGISFLPLSEHTYAQAPYEAVSQEDYREAEMAMPEIDWEGFAAFETEDGTTGSQELACVGGACEIP